MRVGRVIGQLQTFVFAVSMKDVDAFVMVQRAPDEVLDSCLLGCVDEVLTMLRLMLLRFLLIEIMRRK